MNIQSFFVGGQQGYVNPGHHGLYVHDDMGDAVKLDPDGTFNWVEFALDRVVIKSEVPYTA